MKRRMTDMLMQGDFIDGALLAVAGILFALVAAGGVVLALEWLG